MTAEQFQQLMDMMGTAGEGAFVLAILYMIIPIVQGLVIAGTFITVTALVAKATLLGVSTNNALKEFRTIVDGSGYGNITERELSRIRKAVSLGAEHVNYRDY